MGSNGSSSTRMEEIKNETPDLEQIPIDDVFKLLNCSRRGLTTEEGRNRLQIEEREDDLFKLFGCFVCRRPSLWDVQIAALFAAIVANGIGGAWDLLDILAVLSLASLTLLQLVWTANFNSWGDKKAQLRVAALMGGAAASKITTVLRDGDWREQDAAVLVPGDIIRIKSGDTVPADARLLEGDYHQLTVIDQLSGVTAGRASPLPVTTTTKNPGEVVSSGSTCKLQGEAEAVVIATDGTARTSSRGKAAAAARGGNSQDDVDVLRSTQLFCMCCVAIGIVVEMVVMCLIQKRRYKDGVSNSVLVLLVGGGILVAAPRVLAAASMAFGTGTLFQLGAIAKSRTAIEKMAGMDVLCCDEAGTLTLNRPVVERDLIEVFAEDVDKDRAILLAARASRTDNLQDHPIDAAILGMLADPKEARAGITEVDFQPFNPVDKRTVLTYIDCDGNWHRVSKGDPEQILNLCRCKHDIKQKAHSVIDKFAERGLWSLGVACQQVLEKNQDSPGQPWQFVALLGLFDPPMLDSVDAIRMARDLGVDVKMITGDELAIAKETGRRLGMGENMYPSSILFSQEKDATSTAALPMVDKLIEKVDGFAGALPEHRCAIVERLQRRKHICGMTGDGVNDVPALEKADVGIAVAGASDAALSASDVVFTKPGLSAIVSAVLTSRAIFWRMKSYTIYAVSIAIFILLGSMLITLIWHFDFPRITVLLPYVLYMNEHVMMLAIPTDRVRPSPHPESWSAKEVLVNGIGLGSYSALTTIIFFWAMKDTDFFTDTFHVRSLRNSEERIRVALFLQATTLAQSLILVTRSRSWFFVERPGLLLSAFLIFNQLWPTLFFVYARGIGVEAIGWGWAGVIWLYNVVFFFPLDLIKFAIRYILGTGSRACDNLLENKTAFAFGEGYKVPGKSPTFPLRREQRMNKISPCQLSSSW